jgi:hypothetical protein
LWRSGVPPNLVRTNHVGANTDRYWSGCRPLLTWVMGSMSVVLWFVCETYATSTIHWTSHFLSFELKKSKNYKKELNFILHPSINRHWWFELITRPFEFISHPISSPLSSTMAGWSPHMQVFHAFRVACLVLCCTVVRIHSFNLCSSYILLLSSFIYVSSTSASGLFNSTFH